MAKPKPKPKRKLLDYPLNRVLLTDGSDTELARMMRESAQRNGRTLGGQIRYILREWMRQEIAGDAR